ncbi:MAG TPA: peptidase S10, partial [Polyangia bacterium]
MADAAQPESEKKDADKKMQERVDKLLAQAASESSGSIRLGGKSLDYAVAAAFLPVIAEGFEGALGEPQAAVMATSYVLKGADARERPVCFAFNGGPGSASIWLHLGALGPKRVATPDDASMPTAPFAVVDNPHSWFEHFDLVFIDPPHTGWSSTSSVEARKKMLSVDGDVTALTEVMRVWLTRHKRWSSPVYLAGES